MIRWLLFLGSAFCIVLPSWAQQRPLRTDDAELLDVGRIRSEFGMEFLQKQRFSLSGLEGDLSRLGVLSLHAGVGEYAEVQISGVLQDYMSVSQRFTPYRAPDFTGNSTHDFGDVVLATKLKLAGDKGARPAMAFKFAVQLPNASQTKGLGNDETQFYTSMLFSKHLGKARLLGNVGIAILGNPAVSGQSDLITYGAGVILPVNRKVNLVGEINGRQTTTTERIGNEPQSQARLGLQFLAAGLRWDVGGITGLKRFDADSGVAVGVTYEFKAFHK